MTDIAKTPVSLKAQREKALAKDRQDILGMSPEKALDVIADHPYPVTLVQSFAEEDLYLLVHSIGPDDALPILGMASNDQWDYFLDTDIWQRDQIDIVSMTRWLDRLLEADPDRFTHWISHSKTDELSYYLFRNIEVILREHDQDPSDFGEEFFSEDQTHYVRLRAVNQALETGKQYEEERDMLVTDILKRIAVYDYAKYVTMLLESTSILPAEAEEELYRLRNVRLAEKGFIPHDEAVGVYQPLSVGELHKRSRKSSQPSGRPVEAYPMPIMTRTAQEKANLFEKTLADIQDDAAYQLLQSEFAGLCNQVIAADQIVIRQKEALNQVVAKVSDYISLGLEKIRLESGDTSPMANTLLVRMHLLGDLFRVGYGCALELKWKAERWQKSAWSFSQGLAISFWAESGMGVLGGLLLKKPLRYDPTGSGSLYKEFATLEQIQATAAALEDIITFDRLLARMPMEIGPAKAAKPGLLTYQSLLLTQWAHHYLGSPDTGIRPLALDQFRDFFKNLWQEKSKTPAVKNEIKEHFLNWLAGRTGLKTVEISEHMGKALEGLFNTLETELGHVEDRYLDPRFIHLFILK